VKTLMTVADIYRCIHEMTCGWW